MELGAPNYAHSAVDFEPNKVTHKSVNDPISVKNARSYESSSPHKIKTKPHEQANQLQANAVNRKTILRNELSDTIFLQKDSLEKDTNFEECFSNKWSETVYNVKLLKNYTRVLSLHKKECEHRGEYNEAKLTAQRLQRLLQTQNRLERENMNHRHKGELELLEEQIERRTKQFFETWETLEVPKLRRRLRALKTKLLERHAEEIKRFTDAVCDSPARLRPTCAVLQLERQARAHGYVGNYSNASSLQKKAKNLLEYVAVKQERDKAQSICRIKQNILTKQNRQHCALKRKISRLRFEKKNEESQGFAQLQRHSRILRAALGEQQADEKRRLYALTSKNEIICQELESAGRTTCNFDLMFSPNTYKLPVIQAIKNEFWKSYSAR